MNFSVWKMKRPSKLLLHIIAWAIIFLLPFIFSPEYQHNSGRTERENEFLYLNTVTKVFWVLLFYLNTVFLIPKFLYRRKYMIFALLQLLLFVAIMGIHGVFFELIVSDWPFNFYSSSAHNMVPFLFTVLVSIAFKTVSDRLKTERVASEKQRENLRTELSFLRSQISPHFLFNVLNNIVALVRMKSEELEPTILKLSSLMQYMLYETDEEKVLLKSEVDYLKSYIDLQQQRFGNRLTLKLQMDIEEDWHAIEPMLLIPFVENAFKHGTGMVKAPVIEITLKAADNELLFVVRNMYIELDEAKDKDSGIGLANVKRRLELLYGKHHRLTIDKANEWFAVSLQLTFKT